MLWVLVTLYKRMRMHSRGYWLPCTNACVCTLTWVLVTLRKYMHMHTHVGTGYHTQTRMHTHTVASTNNLIKVKTVLFEQT